MSENAHRRTREARVERVYTYTRKKEKKNTNLTDNVMNTHTHTHTHILRKRAYTTIK